MACAWIGAEVLRPEPAPQRVARHVVDECALAVDLDHRQPLAVALLQLRVAADVDLEQLEVVLAPKLCEPTTISRGCSP